MHHREAILVLRIMATADGGCNNCVQLLFDKFTIKFPQFKLLADKIYQKEFGDL